MYEFGIPGCHAIKPQMPGGDGAFGVPGTKMGSAAAADRTFDMRMGITEDAHKRFIATIWKDRRNPDF